MSRFLASTNRLPLMLVMTIIGVSLSGCTPEQRALMRLTALGFKDQATIAIAAVRGLYQRKDPPRSLEESRTLLIDRLLQSKLNVGDVRQVDRVITRSTGQPAVPRQSQVDAALNDLNAEYEAAGAVFSDIDQLDVANPRIVAQAAKPARHLTVKMLLLAKLISQSPPTPGDPARVAISVKLDQLRRKYSTVGSEAERQALRNQVSQQIDEWLRVDTDERGAVCDAIAKLVQAAETGQKLSKLTDDYAQRRIEDLIGEIVRIVGVTSSVTGRDYGAIASRLQDVNTAITNDTTLSGVLKEILNSSAQTTWTNSALPVPDSQFLQCQP